MKRINDIFYSLQGEGHNTGRAAVFIRFAGCNLRCPFCDTEFDSYREMTDEDIMAAISQFPARFVVLTGGEPTLQTDKAFIDQLHFHGFEVAMESNGTRPAPENLDWLTVSPKVRDWWKGNGKERVKGEGCMVNGIGRMADELKIVFDETTDPTSYLPQPSLPNTPRLYLQPCDTGDAERNADITNRCIDYIKKHPQWCLSLQTHKLIGFK